MEFETEKGGRVDVRQGGGVGAISRNDEGGRGVGGRV